MPRNGKDRSHPGLRRLVVLAVLALSGAARPPAAIAQTAANGGGAVQVNLQTMLDKGLRCRRPQEFEYVAEIVDLVNAGELPETLVRNIYGWARRRSGYPLQYFQFALQRQAATLGIAVPTIRRNSVDIVLQ